MSIWKRTKGAVVTGFFGGAGAGFGIALLSAVSKMLHREGQKVMSTGVRGAELLEEFRTMPDSETVNLRRRYREALERNDGTRFTALLLRIPRDPATDRRLTLKYLNDVPDEEFEQLLQMLQYPKTASGHLAERLQILTNRIEGPK